MPNCTKVHEPEYDFVDLVEYVYEKKLSAYHFQVTPNLSVWPPDYKY